MAIGVVTVDQAGRDLLRSRLFGTALRTPTVEQVRRDLLRSRLIREGTALRTLMVEHPEYFNYHGNFRINRVPNNELTRFEWKNGNKTWFVNYFKLLGGRTPDNYRHQFNTGHLYNGTVRRIVNNVGLLHPRYTSEISNSTRKNQNRTKEDLLSKIQFNKNKQFIIKNYNNSNTLKNLVGISNFNNANGGTYKVAKISYEKRSGKTKPPTRYVSLNDTTNNENSNKYIKKYLMSLPIDEFKRIRRVTTGKLLVSKNSIANINSKKVTPANRTK